MPEAEAIRRSLFGDKRFAAMKAAGEFDAVIACDPAEDKARQEFKEDSDINVQMRRYGVGHAFEVGSVDYDLDLQASIEAVNAAHDAWRRLPANVRDKWPSWDALQAAAESGELSEFLKPAAAPDGGSSGAAAGSPSGSAAGGGTSGA